MLAYAGVSIIHRTLTWTPRILNLHTLIFVYAYTHGVSRFIVSSEGSLATRQATWYCTYDWLTWTTESWTCTRDLFCIRIDTGGLGLLPHPNRRTFGFMAGCVIITERVTDCFRVDSITLFPATFVSAFMTPSNPGHWLMASRNVDTYTGK